MTRAGFVPRAGASTPPKITNDDESLPGPRGRTDLARAQGLADSGRASRGGSLREFIVSRRGTAGALQRRIAVRAPVAVPRGRDPGCQHQAAGAADCGMGDTLVRRAAAESGVTLRLLDACEREVRSAEERDVATADDRVRVLSGCGG